VYGQEPFIEREGRASRTYLNMTDKSVEWDAGWAQPVSIRSVVERVTSTYRALAISKSLKYSMAVDPVMPALNLSDETRLHQILGNLIGTCHAESMQFM